MSYKHRVLADSPLGYWRLNQSINNQLIDETSVSNSAILVEGSQPMFADVVPLTTGSNDDQSINGCKIFTTTSFYIPNSNNKYKCFYNGTENLSFGIEFWVSFDRAPLGQNDIITIKHGSIILGKIFVINDKMFFSVYDSDLNEFLSFKQIQSWDSQLHVFAYYSKKSINIAINSMAGQSITLPSSFKFYLQPEESQNIEYIIGPANISPYVLSDIAFYDYPLSANLMKSHMVWGTNDSAPQTYVKQTSGAFFDIKENESMLAYKASFINSSDYSKGTSNNIVIDSDGMTLKTLPPLSQFGGTETSVDENGLSVQNTSSIKFTNLSDYFSSSGISVLGQISWVENTSGLPACILSIQGINNSEWWYLAQSEDNKLSLYYAKKNEYIPSQYDQVLIAQVPNEVTDWQDYNFALCIKNNTVQLYLSTVGYVINNELQNYSFSNLSMYFGNQYSQIDTSPLFGKIKNISILPFSITPTEYPLFGKMDTLTIPFTSNLDIAQRGEWTYNVPSSSLSKIVGARVTWDSGSSDNSVISTSQNVIVQSSKDGGLNWTEVANGYPSVKFPDDNTTIYPDIAYKVSMFTSNSALLQQPRLDNFLIVMYKDLSVISDSGDYVLSPKSGSYVGDTYSIRKNFFNILSRTENFGIKLSLVGESSNVATITPLEPSVGYQTVEFWFRYDVIALRAAQFILDTMGTEAYIYFDSETGECRQVGFNNVFINGILLENGKVLNQGEAYHFVCTYPVLINAQIYLGGTKDKSYLSHGTFGFISLYPNEMTEIEAQNRYLSYLTSNVSLIDYSANINSFGSISEYAGGSMAFNGGSPIMSYNHPTIATV